MIFPKIPSKQKQRLLLNKSPKNLLKNNSNNMLPYPGNSKKQNILLEAKIQESTQKTKKSYSSGSKMPTNLFRHLLKSRKIQSTDKPEPLNIKTDKQQSISVLRLSQKLSIESGKNQKKQDLTVGSKGSKQSLSSFWQRIEQNDKIAQSLDRDQNDYQIYQKTKHFGHSDSPNSLSKQNKTQSLQTPNQTIIGIDLDFKKGQQNNSACRTATHERKTYRIISESLSNHFSVYSLTINPSQNFQALKNLAKKQNLVQELLKDPNFEWKYEQFKVYSIKYSEYEINLKEKLKMLELFTQNLALIKQRITPFTAVQSLEEIVSAVNPKMTPKSSKAYEIKMQMLKWKKKFFSNASRIKQKFEASLQNKCQIVFSRLNQNEQIVSQAFGYLENMKKKETVIFDSQNLFIIGNLMQKIVLNQKQMIDQIRAEETEAQFLFEEFNSIEEEWQHAFEIFNNTLENCVKKCLVLADLIDKLYGKCSNAMFLTKDLHFEDINELQLIQNSKCQICKWNCTKLKRIIEQNSLARDHLLALNHLIAN